MNTMGRDCASRSIICVTLYACVLWMIMGFLFLPSAFGQSKSVPQKSFATPTEAARALAAAYRKGDRKAVAEILGDNGGRLVLSGDPVIDQHERAWFLSLYGDGYEVVADGRNRAVLQLGNDGQPYPIPLIKKNARWRFDPSEGHEDLLSRRISKAELTALNVVGAYVDAQREYHKKDHKGSGTLEYAQRFRSTPGQEGGPYWGGASDKAEGPIAGLVEAAAKEGYQPSKEREAPVYRGYVYKILTAQGPQASGGERNRARTWPSATSGRSSQTSMSG